MEFQWLPVQITQEAADASLLSQRRELSSHPLGENMGKMWKNAALVTVAICAPETLTG